MVFYRFLSGLLRIISISNVNTLFYPLECWKTQKTASNLVSYFLCVEPKFKITQMPSLKKPTLSQLSIKIVLPEFLFHPCRSNYNYSRYAEQPARIDSAKRCHRLKLEKLVDQIDN